MCCTCSTLPGGKRQKATFTVINKWSNDPIYKRNHRNRPNKRNKCSKNRESAKVTNKNGKSINGFECGFLIRFLGGPDSSWMNTYVHTYICGSGCVCGPWSRPHQKVPVNGTKLKTTGVEVTVNSRISKKYQAVIGDKEDVDGDVVYVIPLQCDPYQQAANATEPYGITTNKYEKIEGKRSFKARMK